MDGVCIGHPCCGIAHCKVPLNSNRDRFCPAHSSENRICAVVDCARPVASGSKVCDLVEHQQVETMHHMQGKSRFQLKEKLKRAQLAAHPRDPLPLIDSQFLNPNEVVDEVTDEPDLEPVDHNGEVQFELMPDGQTVPITTDVSTIHRKLRVQFGRKRTHNEQLFVAPCGIIVARETFYHSEAPSAVVVSVIFILPT